MSEKDKKRALVVDEANTSENGELAKMVPPVTDVGVEFKRKAEAVLKVETGTKE
jgi:hypothetical protein